MLIALTHAVSPHLPDCELTFIDRKPIDYQVAVKQHELYCAALSKCGIYVKKLSANLSYPDSCFIEDTAIVLDELAVITSLGVASRRGESAAIRSELAQYRELASILPPATLEGGDVLQLGRRLLVGLSDRTNARGIEELGRIVEPWGYAVCPIRIRGSLHLKTACTALDDETLLVNRQWVDVEQLKGYKILATPEEEPWAANTLRISGRIIMPAGFPQSMELVRGVTEEVEVVEISEFRKAEAGVTCMSLIFEWVS
jgi:dimethylargininase